jgi:peptide/nickel transport system substrate-binding protein
MCESPLLLNPDFSTSPNLAEVTRESDTSYRVTLDSKATFWDGTPVTADDVKFSIERTKSPELGSTWAGVLSNITAIEVSDTQELVIELAKPDVFFEAHLATPAANVVKKEFVVASDKFGDSSTGVMCSGPFEFSEWNIGQNIILNKTANYWDPERAALSDSIRYTFNTDAASAATAMQNGEITGSYNFAISGLDSLIASNGSVTLGTSLGLYGLMTINTDSGPLADPKIREALQLAIDYQGIQEGIFAGASDELRTFTPKSAWGYSKQTFEGAWEEIGPSVTDLDEAASLVSEVGGTERPITLAYFASLPEDAQVATSIQSAAAEIGLDIELIAQTTSENIAMYFDAAAREGIDMMIWAGYLDMPEPAAYYQYYTTEGIFNVAGFSNADFDQVVSEARQTLDDEKRAELMTQAQAIFSENRIFLPITANYTRLYMAEGVSGAVASQAFYYSPWAAKLGLADAN